MQIRLSQQKHRLSLGRKRSLLTLVAIAALLVAAHKLVPLQPNSISAAFLIFLPLVLFAALGAGREFLTPSLKELAFYSFAVVAAMAIWPSANLAAFAYETTGFFVTLLVFMGFVFALAIALGVVAVMLLSNSDSEI